MMLDKTKNYVLKIVELVKLKKDIHTSRYINYEIVLLNGEVMYF